LQSLVTATDFQQIGASGFVLKQGAFSFSGLSLQSHFNSAEA
jgi:hypothetical protein